MLYTIQEIGAEGLQPGEERLDSKESGAANIMICWVWRRVQ